MENPFLNNGGSFKFCIDRKLDRKVISELVTLDARSYVLRLMDKKYKDMTALTITDQDREVFYTQAIKIVLETIRGAFEDEIGELRDKLNNDCEHLFRKPIVADYREKSELVSLLDFMRNKRKSFSGDPTDGESTYSFGDMGQDSRLLRPQKRPSFNHQRSISDVSNGPSPRATIALNPEPEHRYDLSQINGHMKATVLATVTGRAAQEFCCPYGLHSSLRKDHSHRTSCRGTFDGASKLRQHVRIAYRAYFCPVENCFARFPSTDERKGHIEPCKEKGAKANRDISSEDREAFANAKIMMEKNVPLTQIQEIIDKLCKDDNCTCRTGGHSPVDNSNTYEIDVDHPVNQGTHTSPEHEAQDSHYVLSNSSGLPQYQSSYPETNGEIRHDNHQTEEMMVDGNVNAHHPYNTVATTMPWDNTSSYHPRSNSWGAGLPVKNGFSGETQLPPIMVNGPGDGTDGLEYNPGLYSQPSWGNINNVNERPTVVDVISHDSFGYNGIERGVD